MKHLGIVAGILGILWVFSPDKILFLIASLLLLFLIKYSWREDEPKFILLGVVMYWLTVCTLLLYGVFYNQPMIELTTVPETFIFTTYLALIATFLYCSGIFLVLRNVKITAVSVLYKELSRYNGKKLLLLYCGYSFLSSVSTAMISSLGGLAQIAVGILWLKWAFLTLLIVHTLLFPANQKYVYIILLVEVFLSFSGLWSSFKDYFFITGAAFLTFSERLTLRRFFFIGVLAIGCLFLMVVWTVVKGPYREYLTGGKKALVVANTDKLENIEMLAGFVQERFGGGDFDTSFNNGVLQLADRINYTEYFAMAVRHVPDVLPYEDGNLLRDGVLHVLEPRILFPDKAPIDDSKMTSKYTGRGFAGFDQGASFSLGLVAERYIDFGPTMMFVPIFLLGLLIGFIYKYIFTHSFNKIWGLAFVAPVFFLIPNIGVATTKFLGWLFTYFITCIL